MIALLTAGGIGSRMQQDIPKQFLHVNNKPIIIYTLEAFQNNPNIDSIIIAVLQDWDNILWAYAKQYKITKLKWVVTGGATGQESIHNCLVKLEEEGIDTNTPIMIHDGNRPMISQDIIADSIATFKKYGSAVAAIPCVEVVFKSTNKISSNEFWVCQEFCVNRFNKQHRIAA
jgi:2-C-methyl-D-erythritol 4-phosphate cytidylyltransferase